MANNGAIEKTPYNSKDAFCAPITPPGSVIPPILETRPAIAAPKAVAINCTVVTEADANSSSPAGAIANTRVNK